MSSQLERVSGPPKPAQDRLEVGLAVAALVGCVAYGLLHPLSRQVAAPRWFWVSMPLLVCGLAVWQRRETAKLWYVSAGVGALSVGFAFYEHARALGAIRGLDQTGQALLAYSEASAEARGVLLIGVGVALLAALGVELTSARRAAGAAPKVSPQAWVALATWVAALVFGRTMLELPWSVEDFCAVFSVLALALLVHAGASLSVAVWVPLGFVVLAWLRADIEVGLSNYDYESLYESGLKGGLELVRRERLVVLDASASGAAVLLLLWSLRARLKGQLGRSAALAVAWLLAFGADRFVAAAAHEHPQLTQTLTRGDLALPRAELQVRGWLPRAPLWVVGRQRELWLAPPSFSISEFSPNLLDNTSPAEAPLPSPEAPPDDHEGGPRPRPAQGLLRPAVLLAAPFEMKLSQLFTKLGPHASTAFGLLMRDARLLRRDALAQVATLRAVVFKLAPSVSGLPAPERPDLPRYFYAIDSQELIGPPRQVGAEPVRRKGEQLDGFACSWLSAAVHEQRPCEVVVGVDPSWTVRRLMLAVAPLLSPLDEPGSVSFILVPDTKGIAARVQEAP